MDLIVSVFRVIFAIGPRCLLLLTTLLGLLPSLISSTQDQIDSSSSISGQTMEGGRRESELPPLIFQPYIQHRTYGAWVGNHSDKGMDLLYKAVNAFLKELQPNQFPHNLLKDEDLTDPDSLLLSLKTNYLEWLKYEKGYLLTGGVCVVLGTCFTLLYLLYMCCCCCFCGRDSGKPRTDKKCDACKRRACTGVLAVFTVIMVFAVACALISNQYVHETASQLPGKLQYGLEDFEAYKDETGRRVKKLLISDYATLNSTILSAIKKASGVVVSRVKEISGAESLDHLSEISEKARVLEKNLTLLERNMEIIQQNAVALKYNMSRLHQDSGFQSGLKKCLSRSSEDRQKCQTVDALLNQYKTLPDQILDFGKFVSLKDELKEVAKYNISALLSEARNEFSSLEERFNRAVITRENKLKFHLKRYSQNFTHYSDKIAMELQKIDVKPMYSDVERFQVLFVEYEFYRWIGGVVMGAVLGVMVVCLGLGLFYGVCGKRPSYYEDDCCVRSTGSKLYTGGIIIGILCLAAFMFINVGLFLIGANSQNLICDTVNRPKQRNDVFDAVQRLIRLQQHRAPTDLGKLLDETSLTSILKGCEHNSTLYEIFDVEEQLGIRDLLDGNAPAYKELSAALGSLKRDFEVDGNLNQVLISPEAEEKLRKLRHMDLTALPQELTQELEVKMESFNILSELSTVESEVNSVIGREMNFLRDFVRELRKLEKSGLRPLKDQLGEMMEDIKTLNEELPRLTEEVPRWIGALVDAQTLLSTNLTGYINSVASEVSKQLGHYIHEYRVHIRNELNTNVTSCGPLKAMGRASAVTFCDRLLYPFNSFWASMIVCLLLAIPSIMLATSLIDLYKNTERYCKANYMAGGGSSGRSRGRNARVNAYITDDYDHYTRVNHDSAIKAHGSSASNGYANWRTPSSSSYLDSIGSPPPPYSSPKRRNR